MPVLVYWIAWLLRPDADVIRIISSAPLIYGPTFIGGVAFITALALTWRASPHVTPLTHNPG